jgi:glycosyltransferase involved in cell wall biosynthesis
MPQDFVPGLASVIIPTYNRAAFLSRTLQSVFAQTHRPLEILVLDDGSTDNTKAVVQEFEKYHSEGLKFHYFLLEHAGACAARNKGIAKSSGQYLKFLDSDDLLEPEAIRLQVNNIRISKAAVVYGDWWDIYTNSADKVLRRKLSAPGSFSEPIIALLSRRWVANFGYLFTREAVIISGGWDENWLVNQDFGFALRVALTGAAFAYAPGAIGAYRRHQTDSISKDNTLRSIASTEIILKEAEEKLRGKNALHEEIARALAGYYLYVARKALRHNRDLFHKYLAEMSRLCPNYQPPQRWQRWLVKALGYEHSEMLLLFGYRTIRFLESVFARAKA